MFGLGKLQVLESKLDIYEDLSKEMLEKLERAVFTISENSNKVSVILERHESRLDESQRSDQLIIIYGACPLSFKFYMVKNKNI